MTQARMGFNRVSTLLAAAMAISTQVDAQAACDPAAGLTFMCGLTNAEDLVQVPGMPWIVASGLAEGEHASRRAGVRRDLQAKGRTCGTDPDLGGLRRIFGRRLGQRRSGVARRRLRSKQSHEHQRREGGRQADGGGPKTG